MYIFVRNMMYAITFIETKYFSFLLAKAVLLFCYPRIHWFVIEIKYVLTFFLPSKGFII